MSGSLRRRLAPTPEEHPCNLSRSRLTAEELESLRARLQDALVLKDRVYGLKLYRDVFLGTDAVTALQQLLRCDETEAVRAGNALLKAGYLRHCCGDHTFKNKRLFYNFVDPTSGTARSAGHLVDPNAVPEGGAASSKWDTAALLEGLRQGVEVKDRTYGLKAYRNVFLGTDAVACLQRMLECDEAAAIEAGNTLITAGFIHHCCFDHMLRNKRLFYAFSASKEDPPGPASPTSGPPSSSASSPSPFAEMTEEVEEFEEEPSSETKRPQQQGPLRWHLAAAGLATVLMGYLSGTLLVTMLTVVPLLGWLLWGSAAADSGSQTRRQRSGGSRPKNKNKGAATDPTPRVPTAHQCGLPPVGEWPHRPLLLRSNHEGTSPSPPLPVNSLDPIPVESPLFRGCVLVRIRDCPNAPTTNYFDGRNRKLQMVVQGRFLKDLPMAEVYTGEVQARPLTNMPPAWMVRTALGGIRKLSPGLQGDLQAPQPYVINLLASTAQALRCDRPESAPSIDGEIAEETSLLGAPFSERSVSSRDRKKFFAQPSNAARFHFKTDFVYTFDFYQHLLLPLSFELLVPVVGRFDLVQLLNGQPIHFMSKHIPTLPPSHPSSRWLWNFELWHERLLSGG